MFACAGFFNLKLEDIFEVRHFFYLNYFVPQKWCDNQERNGEAIIRLQVKMGMVVSFPMMGKVYFNH
jgi:hypothetical protein